MNSKIAKPTAQQILWLENERMMFVHFDPCTWTGKEYDDHTTDLSEMRMEKLNTDQWCETTLSWGARAIIFVAKHVGGFCWWQTNTSNYGIKETPYKNGKGDVLGELSRSCRKYGLKLGVYISPSDLYHGTYIGSGGKTADPSKQEEYSRIFRQQLTEVLTRYGEIYEIWFDGSCVIDVSDIFQQYAPNAMIFQSPQATIRWSGSESGKIPYPLSSAIQSSILKTGISTGHNSDVDGDVWAPIEVDTTLYDHYWFWAEHKEKYRKTLDELMDCYYMSVGRGGVLLLNSTPNTDGLIPEKDVKLYKEFGDEIVRRFSLPVGVSPGKGMVTEVLLNGVTEINHVVIDEEFSEGERVRGFEIEALTCGGWRKVYEGSLIGRRHIAVFETVIASRVRIKITKHADGLLPLIKRIAVYNVRNVDISGLISRLKQSLELYDYFRKEIGEWSVDAGSRKQSSLI